MKSISSHPDYFKLDYRKTKWKAKRHYKKRTKILFSLMMLICFGSFFSNVNAQSNCSSVDFASPLALGGTSAPGTWYTDRFAPSSFEAQQTGGGRANVLKHSIAAADGQTNAFQNTQGRKYDLPQNSRIIQVDLYVPSDWATSGKRMAGLWGTAYNSSHVFTNESYPIIEFTSEGGNPKFRGYETGTWIDIPNPSGFSFNTWVTLRIELQANKQYLYSVIASDGSISSVPTSTHPVSTSYIGNAILQGHNVAPPGVTYDIYWDNLGATTGDKSITNTNTREIFCSIQAAINDADTENGHVIEVSSGTYTENLDISKAIILQGPNSGLSGNSVSRSAEAILSNCSLVAAASGSVTISGFHILQTDNTPDVFLLSANASVTVENNIFERNGVSTGQIVRAITTSAGSGAKTIRNNLFTGDISGGLFSGHKSWNSGIYVNGGNSSTVAIETNTFKNVRGALNLDDFQMGITIVGNTFETCGTYLSFGGTAPTQGSFTLGVNDFKTPVSTFINLSNVNPNFRLNISGSTYNGAAFPTDLASLFAIEAFMFHRGRSGRNGLVTVVNSNQYVVAGLTTIQSAIDAADVNDVINVANGSYIERLTIPKAITLNGTSEIGTILSGSGLSGSGSGIFINNNISGVTIRNFTIQNFTGSSGNLHAGIYANAQNNNLSINAVTLENNSNASGIYANGPVSDVLINDVNAISNGPSGRGIVIWNGLKKNITITNSTINNNSCCGIELQDGTATGVLIQNNNIIGADNAIGVVGLTSGSETSNANIISNNTISVTGRYGIEVKNPNGTGLTTGDGAIVIEDNTVNYAGGIADARDLAGIAVFRRGVLAGNVDVPKGVVVRNNTVSNFAQSSASDGFGIVIEGTDHTVTGNTLQNNDVGIQQQAGYGGYPGDGDQANLADLYFGRGNSPATCGNTVASNNFSGNTSDTRLVGTAGTGYVLNTNTSEQFCSIQAAINAPNTVDTHTLQVPAGTYSELLSINKSLIFTGVAVGVSGTDSRPAEETVLSAPVTGSAGVISLSSAVSATFDGFKIDGKNVAYISAANQNLTIKNSVFELDFAPNDNNLYFVSNVLTLDSNYFQAVSGTNNGASSHIFFGGAGLAATENKFTSEAARSSMSITTQSLPTWFNVTGSANNVNIHHNDFNKIDIGILLAANAGNVLIENNEFKEANRETLPFGSGMAAGIVFFENLTPSAPVLIKNNKFLNSDSGIRTSGNGTTFPPANLLSVSYNSFVNMSDKAVRLGGTYAGSTNKLNLLCNWFGATNGPETLTNDGGNGTEILDGGNKVAYKNWLIYGTDNDDNELGFQLPATITVSPTTNSSIADNDYRILSNAIGCVQSGQTLALNGSFTYTGPALTEWAKGNDGEATSAGDNYVIAAPVNLNDVIITGPATINGPGDLAAANLEGFLSFNNGFNRNWDISGLTIKDFDLGIGFFSTANYPTNNSDVNIHDNVFYIPKDLNTNESATDVNQNIGIHLANGANQKVSNNTVYIDGQGVSAGIVRSTSIFLQSATTGGNGYDGLSIDNNDIIVTGTPQAEPAVIRGIWGKQPQYRICDHHFRQYLHKSGR